MLVRLTVIGEAEDPSRSSRIPIRRDAGIERSLRASRRSSDDSTVRPSWYNSSATRLSSPSAPANLARPAAYSSTFSLMTFLVLSECCQSRADPCVAAYISLNNCKGCTTYWALYLPTDSMYSSTSLV